MATDTTTPLEGAEPGFFSEGGTVDNLFNSVGNFFEKSADMVGDTGKKIVTGEFDLNPFVSEQDKEKYSLPQKITDDDRELAKESKAIGGWQMAKDIGGAFWNLGKSAVKGNPIADKLNEGISEEDFQNTISKYREDISSTAKIVSDISSADPKYAQYRDFEDSSYKEYLQARGINEIKDATDYEKFKQEKIMKLNALDQQLIISQYQDLQAVTSKYQSEVQAKQTELDSYINASIKAEGEKRGLDIFAEIEKENENQFKNNKYLQYNQKISQKIDDQVTQEFEKDGRSIAGLGESFSKLKDAIVEQRTAREMYRLDLIGMDDLPDNEKYAGMIGDANQSFAKFEGEFARNLSKAKDDPANKGMSEVDLREQIQSETWKQMSSEDKTKMRGLESLVTGINAIKNYQEAGKRIEDFNPQAILDGLSLAGTTFQSYVDQVFDFEQDVPHYIKQETRSLLYSDEGNLKKLGSMVTYNTDALASLLIPIKGTGLVTKGVDKTVDLLAKTTDKILSIPTKVGFTQGMMKVIPNGMKGFSQSLITGSVGDPVFDNLMMQAPTKAVEDFNNITNLFFDTTLFSAGQGVALGFKGAKNMNGIMFNFLHGDEAAAVKEWTKAFNDNYNPGELITETQGREILEQGRKVFGNIYNPQEIKQTFDQKGGIYKYLADNISQMTDAGMKEVLTGNGLGIRIEDVVGIPREEYKNIGALIDLSFKRDLDPVKAKVVASRIEDRLSSIESFVTKGSLYDGAIIQQQFKNNPDYLREARVIEIKIGQIRQLLKTPGATEEIKASLSEVNDRIRVLRENYTNKQWPTTITLIDGATDNEIKIGIKDLQADLDGKNFTDLLAEGRVSMAKDGKNLKAGSYLIKGAQNNVFSSYVQKFIKNIDSDISRFELENNLNPQSDKLKQNITNLLNNGRIDFGYLGRFSGEEFTSQRKALVDFVNMQLKSFYGEKYINKDIHFIGDGLKSPDEVIQGFQSNPGYMNLSYGSFVGEDGKNKTMLYLTFGNEINESDIIKKKLYSNVTDDKKDKSNIGKYAANANAISKLIVKYGIDDNGIMNFSRGLQKAKVIESTTNTDDLFDAGKLSRTAVARIVNDALHGENIDDVTKKTIIDFAHGLFSSMTESNAMLVKPMTYNLVARYFENKPLIDSLFKNFTYKKDNFIEAFANILISPGTYEDMAKKIASRSDQKYLTDKFELKHNQAWLEYSTRLKGMISKLSIEIDEAKATRKITGSYEALAYIDMQIENLKSKKSSVIKVLKKEQEFKDNLLEKNLQNINIDFLRTQSNELAFTKMLRRENLISKGDPQTQLQDYLSMRDSFKKLYPNNREVFDSLIADIQKLSSTEDRLNFLTKYEGMEYASDDIKNTVNGFIKQYLYPQEGVTLYDNAALESFIKNMDGKYEYQFAKDNNPLKKYVNAWINNTNTGRDPIVEKKISEYFNETSVKSADELYTTNADFKEMVDSLFAKTSSEGDADVPKVYVKAIRDGKDSIKKFITAIFDGRVIDTDQGNITSELIDDMINDHDIIKKLKAIANRKIGKNDINISLIDGEADYEKVFSLRTNKYNETVLQIDNMEKAGMNFKAIRGFSVNQSGFVKIGDTTLNKLYDNYIIESFAQNKENPLFAYSTASEKYKVLTRIINNQMTPEDKMIVGSIDRESIISQLGIPSDHVFVGNFGDKDSLYATYKSGLDIYGDISDKDKSQIELSLYKYEYAFANGYTTGKMESFEQFKNKFLTKKFSSFEEYKNYMHENVYDNVNGKLVNQYILPRDTIRKREAFNMSNNTTFEGYVVPTKTYIIAKEFKAIPELQNFPIDGGDFNGTLDDLNSLIREYPDSQVGVLVKQKLDEGISVEQINDFLNTTFNNDLQDGTSFVSDSLARTRAFIQGGNRGIKDFDEGKHQFKDHFFGEINGQRFGGKTLFNSAQLEMDGAPLKNGVVIGESSMKLKGGYKKYPEPKEIIIDGKVHKVIGEVPGTDTSFFKNAASDSFKDHSDLTMSDSIKGRIGVEHAKAIEALQIRDIKAAFEEALGSLSEYKISLNSFGDVTNLIKLITSEAKIGIGADAIVKGKMTDLLVKIDGIINKPKNPGQSMFIRESNLDIGRNEVIMSEKSDFVIQARKEIQAEIDKLDPITDADQIEALKKDMKDNLYTVGYRYPVPSIYNLGVYKIRVQEDLDPKLFGQYKNMGKDQVVTHPLTTYMKLEGDNDGDHVFFLSARGEMGKILSNAVLDKKPNFDVISFLKGGEWDNKFIVAEQVEKGSVVDSEDISLLESRSIALEAKQSIGVVSATLRTLGTLRQMFSDKANDETRLYFQEIVKNKDGESIAITTDRSIKDIKNIIGDLGNITNNPKFDALAASILQTTLDFGNSGKTTFDKNWYIDLLKEIGVSENKIPDIYFSIISPLSMGYNNADIKEAFKVGLAATSYVDKKTGTNKYQDDLLFGVTGSKRNLHNFLINEKIAPYGKSIAEFINDVNKTHDLKFITDELMGSSKDANVRSIVDYMNKDIPNFEKYGYIKKEYRGDFRKFIEGLGHSDEVLSLMGKIKDYASIKDDYLAKKAIGDSIFSSIETISKDERAIASLYAASFGESNLFNYFTIPEKLLYLTSSDKRFIEDIGAKYSLKLPTDSLEFSTFKDDVMKNIEDLKADLVGEKNESTIDQIEYNLSKQELLNQEIDKLILNLEQKGDSVEDIVIEKSEVPEVGKVMYPEFSFEEIDVSPQSLNELLSENVDFVTKARDGVKLTMQGLFDKYAPRLKATFDDINSFLNAPDRIVSNASDEHARQFGNIFFGYKNSIYRQLKKAGVSEDKLDRLGLVIQHSLIGNAGGNFHGMEKDIIVKKLTGTLEEYGVGHLINDSKFMDEIYDYNDKVISVAVTKLNEIQRIYGFDIHKAYKDLDLSMITDLFEAHKADPQLALKLMGIKDRQAFEKYIKNNAEEMGIKVWDSTVRIMANAVYKNNTGLDMVLNFVKGVHYQMTYGTMATIFTQNNIVAGLAQVLPNYVELRSFMDKDPTALKKAYYVMNKYRLLDSENVLMFGTGHGKNMKNTMFEGFIGRITKDMVEGTFEAVGVKKNKAKKAGELVDSFTNNMLGFNDWPLENLRKMVAILNSMESLGYKTVDQLDRAMENGGKDFEMAFHSYTRRNFANTGGGVVSSSPIASGTVFENSYEYFDNWVTQFAVKSLSYLMGWSFHKMATLVENQTALFTGVKKLIIDKDARAFRSHMNDWLTYNTMLGRQIGLTMGIYLKFQKYEKDNEDRISLESFQKQFNNAIVAVLIPLERHFAAYETANELGEGTDATLYTINSLFKQMTRLFKQASFFNTMFDHYKTKEALGEGDMLESFQYAMDNHYTAYMRFSGMEKVNDYYNTLGQQTNLGILGVGGNTPEDDMFSELTKGKAFTSWKDKGFISSILSGFTGIFKISDTDVGMTVATDLAKMLRDRVSNDPELSKLLKGGQIGKGVQDYNIMNLIGNSSVLSPEQEATVSDMWKEIQYFAYKNIDNNGNLKVYGADGKLIQQDKIQQILEERISKELAKKGINLPEYIASSPGYDPSFLKTIAVLELDSNLKTPLVIATMMNMELKALTKGRKETEGVLTGEKSAYGTPYKALTTEQYTRAQRDVMLKYQEYFNLDNNLVTSIVEKHIARNNEDLFSKFYNVSNMKFIKEDVYDLVKRDYLARNIMQNGDTKVSALLSRYTLAYKGIKNTETGVQVILNHLREIENAPGMDGKTRLANQAATLMSLNKTQYGILKDNKEFAKLTEDSQKQLTNWLFKVSSASLDYDSESMMSQMNQAAGSKGITGSRYARVLPKAQSSSFSGQRPNFAKQFSPMREFIPGKEQFLDRDPSAYLKAKNDFNPRFNTFNPAQFPIVQEYAKIIISSIYYGYESKGIIKNISGDKKFDKNKNTSIKLAKPKKAKKKQEFKKFKEAPKVSMGMRPDLPLANYGK